MWIGLSRSHREVACPVTTRFEKNNDFFLNKKIRFFLFKSDFFNLFYFFIYLIFLKSGIHNVIKYFTIRLSGVSTATQLHKCAYFVLLY